jgi:hypothetical protein
MNHPYEPSPRWDVGDVADPRAEALDVVSDALRWLLTETRWPAVEQLVVAMETAVETADRNALEEATAELELAGPLRMTRIGAVPLVPPPPRVLDRLNRLVYSLGSVQGPQEGS